MTDARVPGLVAAAGERARRRFIEYFTAEIRNPNTRRAYFHAVQRFSAWCEQRGMLLSHLSPVVIASYIEEAGRTLAPPSVKQHLAAIRMLCDYLVLGHVLEMSPAAAVRGPKYVIKKGKTPVLSAEETRCLLGSFHRGSIADLRNRALIAVMVYSFARVGAVVKMNVEDYYQNGKRYWFRLHEKGGKFHQVPVHHVAEVHVDAYLSAAGIGGDGKQPLFRSLDRNRRLTLDRIETHDVLRMIKRQTRRIGITDRIGCHTFRATGITEFLRNGGSLESAARIACHESTRTTQLYNRVADEVTLDEIERIVI